MLLLQVQLSPKDSNLIQANWTSQILVCGSISNLDNKKDTLVSEKLYLRSPSNSDSTLIKTLFFYHSLKRTFSKAAADTLRVYEFYVSLFLSSCKRTPGMKPHSHLNLLILTIFYQLDSLLFSDTRPVILQHTPWILWLSLNYNFVRTTV